MNIRSFTPDYAYLADCQQANPYELVGVHMELEGNEVSFLVQDTPNKIASAFDAMAAAIRRKWAT